MRTKNIGPYRLNRKKWTAPRRYVLTISQDRRIRGDRQSLQCCIPLTLIMALFNSKSAVFWLQLHDPAFNGSRDYDKMQWVFVKLMSLSRHLNLRTCPSGAVEQILNESNIREQWPGIKQQILELYDDSLVEYILALQEQKLTNNLQSMYTRDPMIQLLFNDLFVDYEEGVPNETKQTWPRHLRNIPLSLIERKQLTARDARRARALIAVDGRTDPERVDHERINKYFGLILGDDPAAPYHVSYTGEYCMDTSAGAVQEVTLQVEGTLGDTYSKKTTYHIICTGNE